MNLKQMEAVLEALEMAREALDGEMGKKELRLTKAVIALRIAMLRSDVLEAQRAKA